MPVSSFIGRLLEGNYTLKKRLFFIWYYNLFMGWHTAADAPHPYHKFPKVELHRHLEGSLRLQTLLEVAIQHGITLPLEPDLSQLVSIQPGDPLNSKTFLSKFQVLRLFYRSEEVIRRVTREAVEDAALDGVLYLELRFTPVALTRAQDFPLADVMDWVAESAAQAGRDCGIPVRLIASVNRHEPVELAETVMRLAAERIPQGIVGLDLAGNEVDFPAAPFAPFFRQAQKKGLHLSVHAGEWGGAANVREALELLGAERICHGVRVMEDPQAVELARKHGAVFEVCPTSNYQSGVVPSLDAHPLRRMLQAGLQVTINTDDPSISRITLSDEYRLAVEVLGLSQSDLLDCVRRAAQAAFVDDDVKKEIMREIAIRETRGLWGEA